MKEVISRCGYRCDLCLAYLPNVEANPSNRGVLSEGWHAYFGFKIPPTRVQCDGCMAEAPRLIDQACPVRPCAIARGVPNCGVCSEYVCDRLQERLVVFEEVAAHAASPIPAEDQARFIAPYKNKARLDALRRDAADAII